MIRPVLAAPLSPDADEARDRLERELSDPVYAAAEPTWFDRIARAVGDFFSDLFDPALPDALGPVAAIVAAVLIAVVIVVALIVWGLPRRRARAERPEGALFADDDTRSAVELRGLADAAASEERWDDAIVLRFRAIARALVERVIVDPAPGATAQAFARDAARAFPDSASPLADAARTFDDVRYLRRPGTARFYADVTALDDALGRSRPATVGVA